MVMWVRDNWEAVSHTYCNGNYYVTKTVILPLLSPSLASLCTHFLCVFAQIYPR